MIRRPLRPLARILRARAEGADPAAIEQQNRQDRTRAREARVRPRAAWRLKFVALAFVGLYGAIGVKMTAIAASEPEEPRAETTTAAITSQRADITDRNGRILATNFDTFALYAQPRDMVDPVHAAQELVTIFPELDGDRLLRDFTSDRTFLWVRRQISPEQMQAVHDIGDPGLLFGPREMRLYPNGPIAAHVLGGASYGREGVDSAEVIGVAGVERFFDATLRDPGRTEPLALSLDLTVQAAMEEVLLGGMTMLNARGAAAIIMDVHTGEIIAMASLPDFDPNARPPVATEGDPGDSPLFNRALQGVYELGSVMKIFPIAEGLDLGLINPDTMIDTRGPMTWGRFRINDFHNYGPALSATDVIVKSSNIGTSRVALMIGPTRQRAFLDRLGFLTPTTVEMVEAPTGAPQYNPDWSEISAITISYGHGLSVSNLHLAAGYAALVNGGTRITPTLLRTDRPQDGERVISTQTSAQVRSMLRAVVERGTASLANVEGYEVAGKTGTADKPDPRGGYYDERVIATFAGTFPASDPAYVVIVSLDEPVETSGTEPRRTAGWTAVPVTAELIRRTAPLLGLRPQVEVMPMDGVIQTSN
jgi:cell division protein FtsI (penicillin-binding protein 3)